MSKNYVIYNRGAGFVRCLFSFYGLWFLTIGLCAGERGFLIRGCRAREDAGAKGQRERKRSGYFHKQLLQGFFNNTFSN